MVVHDMRNPSEAINNGLNQAKDILQNELIGITKDLSDIFQSYQLKIKDLKNEEKQLEQLQQLQMQQIQSKDQSIVNFTDKLLNNQPDLLQSNQIDEELQQKKRIYPVEEEKKQFVDEMRNSYECSINSFLQNRTPIFKQDEIKKHDSINIQDEMIFQPVSQNFQVQNEEIRYNIGSQIQQFINIEGINNDQICQKGENFQDQSHAIEELVHIDIIEENPGQRLENTIIGLINDVIRCKNLINENHQGLRGQNIEIQNQNNEDQEDNYSDFHSEDLNEVVQPQAAQIQKPEIIQNNRKIDYIDGSSLIINQIRNINVHQGSQYVKRIKKKDYQGAVNAKEVYIFKENNVLRKESSTQTQNIDEIDQDLKNSLSKIQQNLEIFQQDENFKLLIDSLKNQQMNDRYNEQSQIIENMIQNHNQQENKIEDENVSLQNIIQNKKIIKRKSGQSLSQIDGLKQNKGNQIHQNNQNQQRRFSLSNKDLKNYQSHKKIFDGKQSFKNQLLQQISIKESSQSFQFKMNDIFEYKCNFCKINLQMLIKCLHLLKKMLKVLSKTEFYIKNSISSANVISNLTEDLLTLAKVKNNVFELNLDQNVNLLEIVYEAFQILSFNADQKNITFQLEHQANKKFLIQNVTTDKRRILQILLNFISNSIKFTSLNGFIKIILKVISETNIQNKINLEMNQITQQSSIDDKLQEYLDKQIRIQIQIQDNGAGISKDNLKKLFSDFGKLNEHKQMNVKGTGLGLTICKQLIEQMGGNVRVKSKVGVGSKFIIEFEMEALDQIPCRLIKSLQQSINDNYTENINENFKKIEQYQIDEYLLSSDQSQQLLEKREQTKQYESNNVLLKFLHSKNQTNQGENDNCQKLINKMINKLKVSNQEILYQQVSRQSQDGSSRFNIDKNLRNLNFENQVQGSIAKSSMLIDSISQYSFYNQYINKNNIIKNSSKDINLSLKNSVNCSFQIGSIQESIEKSDQKSQSKSQNSSNHRTYINNQLMQEEPEIDNQQNLNQSNIEISQRENGSLKRIDETYEQSSKFSSESELLSNNMSASNEKSIKSSLINYIKVPIDFQNYLQNNNILKEVIDISFKYKREKLKILVANDEQYTLFFIKTCVDKFLNISYTDTAQNGEEALNLVKKNVSRVQKGDNENQMFYNVIFLDLDMPIMNGNEACKNIQLFYNSLKKKSSLLDKLFQSKILKNKMNNLNESGESNCIEDNYQEEWLTDLKKVYDIYQNLEQNQEYDRNLSKENQVRLQQKLKQEILKVFNFVYQNLRYKSLNYLHRPFMFAYSALVNQKTIEETQIYGFDKCIEAPLNQIKIDFLLEEYVEQYSFNLTKLMLEKLGPVPKFKEMINLEKIKNNNKRKTSSLFNSIFKIQEKSNELQRISNDIKRSFGFQEKEQKLEQQQNDMLQNDLSKVIESAKEQSQSSVQQEIKYSSSGEQQIIENNQFEGNKLFFEEKKMPSDDQYVKQEFQRQQNDNISKSLQKYSFSEKD